MEVLVENLTFLTWQQVLMWLIGGTLIYFAIVKEMEGGDLTLKDLMSHYSEGVGLAKNCMGALERAEQTMDLLVKENEATGKVEESKLDIEG